MKFDDLLDLTPRQLRESFREQKWTGSTGGLATRYLQANLVVLKAERAEEFREFCLKNPQPCPLVDISGPGAKNFPDTPGADFYTDLPRYRVIEAGEAKRSPLEISSLWTEDSVGFLIGCSVTFERALVSASIPVRHLEAGVTAPMYITDVQCQPVGAFNGPVVMTMRAIPADQVEMAAEITSQMPQAHGAPMHIGDPSEIGVDLAHPDYGDLPVLKDGDVPVFWGCGVTPQEVARVSGLDMVTHYPGAMFITDTEMES